ncbi:membrane protein [Actinomadura rubrobrunea]|uniref:Membrane protein n=1 Tax=Actinomadura rubrobrunea TaxID=115335 RepID=A0A9W6PX22_9ACTN|nr:ABC transporter permease [Actinomadura rubrobrunea]GLW65995.1 membrane protein [Actinomadura rubrobrunea]
MLKTTLAGLRAHKLRLLLTGLAITLGVGFIAGTFVLTDSMRAGVNEKFARSADKVDVAVLPKEGGELPADLLGRVRAVPGVTDAQGTVRGDAALIGRDGKAVGDMPTVGISVPSGRLLRYGVDEGRPPAGPAEAVLDRDTAEREKFAVGQTITVLDHRQRPHRFTLVGILDFGIDDEANMRGAVGFDTATAMRMTGKRVFREIDVAGAADRAAVAAVAGPDAEVLTGERLGRRLAARAGADTEVIRTGLLIFGLVSVLVSALVIYNTFAILIAQRMRETALLRCVGATRRQLFGGVLTESAVVGLIGSVLGLAVGLGLGAGALAVFGGPDADIPTYGLTLAPRTIAVGLLVGVLVTVLSALLPARAATRVSPVSALRADLEPGGGRFRLGWARWTVAALSGLPGLAVAWYGAMVLDKGESALFTVAAGGGLVFLAVIALMPALVRPLGRVAGAVPARLAGVPGRLAVQNARRSPRRTATTTIALTIGVGLMTMFAVLAASVKATADEQLAEEFPVDYQLTTQWGGSDEQFLPRELADRLRALPQVAAVTEMRHVEARVESSGRGDRRESVGALTASSLGTVVKPEFTSGSLEDLRPGTVAVADPVARYWKLRIGSTVRVRTPRGPLELKVVGTTGMEGPVPPLLVTEADFTRYFGARDPSVIFVNARSGAAGEGARAAVEAAAKPYPTVRVTSAAEIKKQYTKAIDMMLVIFGALLGLAILIALFGIANTLTLSVVERTRESALLRALGVTRRQLRRMLSVEALIMALIGAGTGVALGVAFGWASITAMAEDVVFSLPYARIAVFVLLAAAAGMLAAVLPARRAAKASVVEALVDD